tara:strand:+ start:431 stop:859 length:429 start_codon:yes stop_codon:yes gene_type:complete
MGKQRNYISNTDYDEALRKFYNGFEDFADHIVYKESILDRVEFAHDIAKEYLEEDEETVELEKGYILTSYGRVFNLRFRRFLTPKFYNSHIYIYCGYNTYRFEDYFNEKGWPFDKVEILRRYISNNWKRRVMENCHYAYLAE